MVVSKCNYVFNNRRRKPCSGGGRGTSTSSFDIQNTTSYFWNLEYHKSHQGLLFSNSLIAAVLEVVQEQSSGRDAECHPLCRGVARGGQARLMRRADLIRGESDFVSHWDVKWYFSIKLRGLIHTKRTLKWFYPHLFSERFFTTEQINMNVFRYHNQLYCTRPLLRHTTVSTVIPHYLNV